MQNGFEKYRTNKLLIVLVITLMVYFAMKFLSPILSPFLFAFLLAGIMNPIIIKIHKKIKIKKSILAGMILFLACLILGTLLWLLCSAFLSGGGYLAGQIPIFQKNLCCLLGDCCDSMERKFGVNGVLIENFVLDQANNFMENLGHKILPSLMGKSMGYMKDVIGVVSYIVVMLIAILLILKDYDRLSKDFKKKKEFQGVYEIAKKIGVYIKTFVKAQLIILTTISTVCALTLSIIGMPGGIWYGLLTGFLDMLPFIGTGIMLIPLVLFYFLKGQYINAIVCFCLYGICALLREFMEPKLIGEKIGVWPVGILFAVFAGISLFGISGIIKGPLSLIIICETCKYIWQN